jgi:hypothetical protein
MQVPGELNTTVLLLREQPVDEPPKVNVTVTEPSVVALKLYEPPTCAFEGAEVMNVTEFGKRPPCMTPGPTVTSS